VVSLRKNVPAVLNAVMFAVSIMARISVLSAFRKKSLSMTHSDEYYMRLALREAEAAFDEGEVPVGAILVLEDRVVASAHNTKEITNDPTAHAEIAVIRKAATGIGNWRLTASTLYVTKESCVMCAGAMINARIGRLVYGCRDSRYGAVTSQDKIVSDPRLNHTVEVLSGILEDECADILKRFFLRLRMETEE
jgi:tRNA(adenine34) deaminase